MLKPLGCSTAGKVSASRQQARMSKATVLCEVEHPLERAVSHMILLRTVDMHTEAPRGIVREWSGKDEGVCSKVFPEEKGSSPGHRHRHSRRRKRRVVTPCRPAS
eukprot:67506-Chlamydomonas_euryale.AAC.4